MSLSASTMEPVLIYPMVVSRAYVHRNLRVSIASTNRRPVCPIRALTMAIALKNKMRLTLDTRACASRDARATDANSFLTCANRIRAGVALAFRMALIHSRANARQVFMAFCAIEIMMNAPRSHARTVCVKHHSSICTHANVHQGTTASTARTSITHVKASHASTVANV